MYGVRESFQGVRFRPPFHLIYTLIYLKIGSKGYDKYLFLLRGKMFEKV